MNQQLIAIRHCATEDNANQVFMGRIDTACSEEALEATRNGASQIIVPKKSRVFSSPLRRCADTANALFSPQTIYLDARLVERDLGDWGGKSKQTIREKYPEAFLPTGFLDPRFTPPHGEKLADFCDRIAGFIRFACDESLSGHALIVVTHNGVIRLIRHLLEACPIEAVFSQGEEHLVPITFEMGPYVVNKVEMRVRAIRESC